MKHIERGSLAVLMFGHISNLEGPRQNIKEQLYLILRLVEGQRYFMGRMTNFNFEINKNQKITYCPLNK